MDKSPQRLTVIWNASPQAMDVSLPAYSASAQIMDKYGRTSPLVARNGYYELSLEPSRNNSDPRDRTLYLVGGSPWIILEDMNQAIAPAPAVPPFRLPPPLPSATPTVAASGTDGGLLGEPPPPPGGDGGSPAP